MPVKQGQVDLWGKNQVLEEQQLKWTPGTLISKSRLPPRTPSTWDVYSDRLWMWSWKAQYPPIFIPAHCEVNVICVVDEKYKALREVSQVSAFELWWGSSLDEASEYAHTDSFGWVPSTAHSVLLASSGILVSLFKILRWPSSIYSWHDVKTTRKGSQKAFRKHPGWQCVQTKMGLSCVLMNQKHTGNIFLNSYPCFQYGTRLDWARYSFFFFKLTRLHCWIPSQAQLAELQTQLALVLLLLTGILQI